MHKITVEGPRMSRLTIANEHLTPDIIKILGLKHSAKPYHITQFHYGENRWRIDSWSKDETIFVTYSKLDANVWKEITGVRLGPLRPLN